MKKMKLLSMIVVLLFFFGNAHAEPVGTLTLVKGTLKLRRNHIDTIYQASGTSVQVENRDELQTGVDTRATINLTAKSDDIELFSKTFFVISGIDKEKSEVKMPLGKARFKINKSRRAGKKRRFRLRTANALVGVKGTEFVVGVADGNTNLLTISGLVSMASLAAPEFEVEVKARQASKIQQQKAPTAPVVVPLKVRENIVSSDSVKEFEAVEFGEAPDLPADDPAEKKSEENEEETQEADETGEVDETVEVDDAVDTDALIEEVSETVDEVQEDIDDTQSNEKAVEFKLTLE